MLQILGTDYGLDTDCTAKQRVMELLYEKETDQIIRILYDVYNELGHGLREKHYENAILVDARLRGISINSQKVLPITYKKEKIGFSRLDLLFFDKILVELKVGQKLEMDDFKQTKEYLKLLDLKIGLLALYSPNGVIVRRVANLY